MLNSVHIWIQWDNKNPPLSAHPDPHGRLDKSMSQKVQIYISEGFRKKIIASPNSPSGGGGGDPGVTLDRVITDPHFREIRCFCVW